MLVERVSLRDFRSYERAETELGAAVTVACGANGAGKTNLLEALHFGLTGRSCRTANEREMIRHGASLARVAVGTVAEDGRHELEVALESSRVKVARVDGAAPDLAAVERARPPVAVFLPDGLEAVKGSPAHRRERVDRFVGSLWPARAAARASYGRALGQRNALLARVRAGVASADQLDAWDGQLARAGADLMEGRAAAVEHLAPRFAARAAELGLPQEAQIAYRPRAEGITAAELAAELAERRAQDLERGFTTHGPHRDDIALLHGSRPLRAFGSQGQQRLALLALLFAERDSLAERGRTPLMLLDDVMSELDATRRQRIVEALGAGGQAVITATDAGQVPLAAAAPTTVIAVEPGVLRVAPQAVAA